MLQGPKGLKSIRGGFSPLPMGLSKTAGQVGMPWSIGSNRWARWNVPYIGVLAERILLWGVESLLLSSAAYLSGSARASSAQAHLAPEQTEQRRVLPRPAYLNCTESCFKCSEVLACATISVSFSWCSRPLLKKTVSVLSLYDQYLH